MRPIASFALLLGLTACDIGDATKKVTSGVVGTTVEATKGLAAGVKDGIDEGRKGATSTDGSTVLSTPAEIAASTQIAVFAVEGGSDGTVVVLAIENTSDTPVHIIGLTSATEALAIDRDGFSSGLQPLDGGTLVVPAHAKVKARFKAEGAPESIATVRIFGQDLAAPAAATNPG
jgi:hypothetical protein